MKCNILGITSEFKAAIKALNIYKIHLFIFTLNGTLIYLSAFKMLVHKSYFIDFYFRPIPTLTQFLSHAADGNPRKTRGDGPRKDTGLQSADIWRRNTGSMDGNITQRGDCIKEAILMNCLSL
jgi:hypothetical protein